MIENSQIQSPISIETVSEILMLGEWNTEPNFFRELIRIIGQKLLPEPLPDYNDPAHLLSKLMCGTNFLDYNKEEIRGHLAKFLVEQTNGLHLKTIETSAKRVYPIMISQLVTLGLELIRTDKRPIPLIRNVFVQLQTNATTENLTLVRDYLNERIDLQSEVGISIHTNFLISKCTKLVKRLELLWQIIHTDKILEASLEIATSICDYCRAHTQIGAFLQSHTHNLLYEITEHTSHAGQKYISHEGKEVAKMFICALGGGAIIAFTCLLKFYTSLVKLPLLIASLGYATNYITSFLLLQLTHLTLATKQPALTASSLVKTLEHQGASYVQHAQSVQLLIKICRTQTLAILGNIIGVIPITILLTWLAIAIGNPPLSQEKSLFIFLDHSPINSLTILYAIFTGIILYFSSWVGGLIANDVKQRNLIARLAILPITRYLPPVIKRPLKSLALNMSITASTIVLGLLLALFPLIGILTGLPLDVRHVTLSTGNLTACFMVNPDLITWTYLLLAMISVATIGFLNLAISFGMGILLSLITRQIPSHVFLKVIRSVFVYFLKNPLKLVFT